MTHESSSAPTPSRREMIIAALGGITGLVAARLAQPSAVAAAPGDPIIMGAANNAGTTNTALTTNSTGPAFRVTQNGSGPALRGVAASGDSYGVVAVNQGSTGTGAAIRANGGDNNGVEASAAAVGGRAIQGTAPIGVGVWASGIDGVSGIGTQKGVQGSSAVIGVYGLGTADGSFGGRFEAPGPTGAGVNAESSNGTGLFATGGEIGVHAAAPTGPGKFAGLFDGDVHVNGTLSKAAGSFRIDHPLDPANKFLSHSFVESPDMLNVYSGTVTTDANGEASVSLPGYFDALNRDVRYQLTVVGADFAQAIVAREARDGRFGIRTDRPGVKVSWQVTGIRQDAYAQAHPIVVEQAKAATDRGGTYLYPIGASTASTPPA